MFLGDSENEDLEREFKSQQRETKRVIRQEKRAYMDRKIECMESDFQNNQSRAFFGEVKRVGRGFQPAAIGVKDKNGSLVTNEQDVRKRWAEHFCELLNQDPPINHIADEIIPPVAGEEDSPTRAEVLAAVSVLKNNKTPGHEHTQPGSRANMHDFRPVPSPDKWGGLL